MSIRHESDERTTLVLGVLWDDDGANVGVEWEITVHGATSDEEAVQACRERSSTITDWEVVESFEPGNFANSRTITLNTASPNPT